MRNWQTTACVFLVHLDKRKRRQNQEGSMGERQKPGRQRTEGREKREGRREGGREGHTLIVLSLEQVASFFP